MERDKKKKRIKNKKEEINSLSNDFHVRDATKGDFRNMRHDNYPTLRLIDDGITGFIMEIKASYQEISHHKRGGRNPPPTIDRYQSLGLLACNML